MTIKYQPLYLKHRPQTLKQLVGQQSVVTTLRNALENDRLAHAYLFTGPRGTGKTSSARILAKSINCQNGPTVDPCLECASCMEVRDSTSTSVFEIDAASNNSVDDARTIIERAPLVAAGGRKKLYIIDECHMLTKEAFNALLKTIEEPPPNVIFILATTEEHKVPPTIVSRCQRLMFRLVNHKDLIEHLRAVAEIEEIQILDDAIELIARRSAGGMRDALGLLDQASLLSRPDEPVKQSDLLVLLGALEEDVLLELSDAVIKHDGKQMIDSANKLLEAGREPGLIAVELAKHFLNLTKACYVSGKTPKEISQFILGSDRYLTGLLDQCRQFERVELSQIVEQLDRMEGSLKRSSMPSLALEIGLLSICHRHDVQSLKEVVARLDDLEKRLAGDLPPASHRPATRAEEPKPAPRPAIGEPAPAPTAPARQERYSEPEPYRPAPAAPPPERVSAPEPPPARVPETVAAPTRDQAPSREEAFGEERGSIACEEPDSVIVDEVYANAPSPERTASSPPVEASPTPSRSKEPPREETSESGDGTIISGAVLEEIWSELLDAVHKRSIPAYSLISVHAFPVRIENGTFIVGVRKEFFQKSIENKAVAVQQAFKEIRNEEIRILVKVFDDAAMETLRRSDGESARPLEPSPRANSAPSAAPARPPDNEILPHRREPEPSSVNDRAPASNQAYKTAVQPSTAAASSYETRPSPSGSVEPTKPSNSPGEREKPKARSIAMEESSVVKEAYDIFEGPGSRMI